MEDVRGPETLLLARKTANDMTHHLALHLPDGEMSGVLFLVETRTQKNIGNVQVVWSKEGIQSSHDASSALDALLEEHKKSTLGDAILHIIEDARQAIIEQPFLP